MTSPPPARLVAFSPALLADLRLFAVAWACGFVFFLLLLLG